ncbi:hypothetical protein D3C71_1307440 [compost metagenome]
MLDGRIDKVEEVVVQHRVVLKGRLARNEVGDEGLGIGAGILSRSIHKMLEDMLPYPPFFIGIGERRNSLGFQLRDVLVQLGQRLRRILNAGFGQQLLVIDQDEQVAFDRKSKHLAVRRGHIGPHGIRHGGSERLICQIRAVFRECVDISSGGRLEHIRRAACGDAGFQHGVVVSLHDLQIDGHVRLDLFVLGNISIESIGVFGRGGEHVNGDRLVGIGGACGSGAGSRGCRGIPAIVAAATTAGQKAAYQQHTGG